MIRQRYMPTFAALVILGALLSACSGGGGGSSSNSPTPTPKTVRWAAPQYFTDTTPLVPSRDLQGFEIYVKRDPSFGPADSATATASALDTTYKLENVSPPLLNGVTYYVSLRTVTVEGMKSDFSPAVSFSIP